MVVALIIDRIAFLQKDKICSLGVLLDPGLLLHKQVTAVACYQLCLDLAQKNLTIVRHALVTSRLDYCNTFYVRLLLETSWKL